MQTTTETNQTPTEANETGIARTRVEFVCADCGMIYTGTRAPEECLCHCGEFELRGNGFVRV